MAKKKNDDAEYKALRRALTEGAPERLYIFHGEERYLLENSLSKLRELADAGGMGGFNHKRFEGSSVKAEDICAAAEALPVFAERTLVEVRDYNLFKADEQSRNMLVSLFDDLPDYLCLVFVYDALDYSPDRRLKTTTQLLKNAHVVDFAVQEQSSLVKWISVHYRDAGKSISPRDAEYLAFVTGGLMTTMLGEIEKTAAFARGDTVTRGDIDAVVTPVLDAVSYKLADAVAAGRFSDAAKVLDELLQMREPPHKLIFGVSLKLRQLYAARLCLEAGQGADRLKELCGIRFDFQARDVMNAARSISAESARLAVLHCADAAQAMNSGADPEDALTGLLLTLAAERSAS